MTNRQITAPKLQINAQRGPDTMDKRMVLAPANPT
ncbi:hypothetical protein DSW25_16925 [Sulfitobacter donghicola DSW-25 = KCTC 12864 = JCM 14565]|uniref:Uncharacterized protein n=1 Tax=Sulfitobacter donghicola DSW-25 = KCTC 12864 = JCM 14565 TaxID=1300350 RepID=A0A073IRV8_9RHOB|nr:hypothetical protein DSW25_16925 [Sulfitobacter donghicola DSW-25 = KCTC 12864 = JCM 14565]